MKSVIKRKSKIRIIVTYELIKDGNEFSIFASSQDIYGNKIECSCVNKFTSNKRKAKAIFKKIYKNKTCVAHLKEVVTDYLCWKNEQILKIYHF